jgi:GxxExxY protein
MPASGPNRYDDADYPFQPLTRRILAGFYHVHWTFGFGFNEAVYRRALAVELRYRGIEVSEHVRYEVQYRGELVGTYEADLVAEQTIIVETKTGLVADPSAPGQLLNYLCAARLPVGLVLHFGPRAQVKRVVRSEYVALERRGRPVVDTGHDEPR